MTNTVNNEKLLGLLGFAMKAGKLLVGTEKVCDGIRRFGHAEELDHEAEPVKKIHKAVGAVLIASDVSANTKKRILDSCRHYHVNAFSVSLTTLQLSDRFGKTGATAAVAVFDKGFSEAVLKLFSTPEPAIPKER